MAVNQAAARHGSGSWVRRFHPARDGAARLVCLPHAGGAATFFFPLSQALSPLVEVLAVQYPGRQDRRAEPCVEDLSRMADLLAGELRPWADRPIALFGHSMGALLAFEVALRLGRDGAAPSGVFASGHRPPSLHRVVAGDRAFHDEELIADLRRLSGTEAAMLDDDETLRMILPCLRGDYRASASYRYRPGELVDCPLLALTGDADPEVTVAEAGVWREHTTGPFEFRVFSGGHFYLAAHQAAIADTIKDALGDWAPLGAAGIRSGVDVLY
jgi:pyochelin biosynthesis protein PchC